MTGAQYWWDRLGATCRACAVSLQKAQEGASAAPSGLTPEAVPTYPPHGAHGAAVTHAKDLEAGRRYTFQPLPGTRMRVLEYLTPSGGRPSFRTAEQLSLSATYPETVEFTAPRSGVYLLSVWNLEERQQPEAEAAAVAQAKTKRRRRGGRGRRGGDHDRK